jgi:D-lactate dehydrogenase (cytochrome)
VGREPAYNATPAQATQGPVVTHTPPAAGALAELVAALGASDVSTAMDERVLHSRDLFSPDDAPLVAAVVRPGSSAEVAAVLRIAQRHGLAVAPRGGGVSYTRGYVPAREGTLSLDLSRMDAIHEINVDDLYVTVGPGVTWQRLDVATATHGLRAVVRGPISGTHATVCGSVSQNIGPASMAGVLGLEVVLADGRIVRTGSGALAATPAPFLRHLGPDLTGLFTGDTGAFGIKTACTLALEPIPAGAAFASVAFDTLAQMTVAMLAIARSGIPARVMGMDPVKNRSATRGVGLREGLGTLASVVKSASSVGAGLRQAAGIASAGRQVLDAVPWSMHVTVESHDLPAAQRALDALRPCWRGAREIPPSVPTAMRARPYSIRGIVGIDGERWVPVHGVFPLSRAAQVVERIEALMAAHSARLQAHGIEVSYIVMTAGAAWLLEPMFYWRDELGPLHERVLGDKFAKFRGAAADPAARAVVRELRAEVTALFDALGGVHAQLGKYYAFRDRLQPDTWSALTGLKDALDPGRTLNPGNLGWD